jgi:dTDP-glucose 4,6-dehydratase
VCEPFELEGPLDWVLHLASPASPVDYLAHPIETLRVNAEGTRRMLELAVERGAAFLLASTSEVYGDPQVHPQPETYWGNVNPIGPRSCYDEGKRYAEALTMAFHRVHGLEIRIARIFNTYGPRMRMDDGRVVPTFIRQALAGEPLTIFGDGSQTRSLCYVEDLIEGIWQLLSTAFRQPVNIGSEEEHRVLEVARLVAEVLGVPFAVRFETAPTDDPRQRRPDTTRLVRATGWRPTWELRDGLRAFVAWIRDRGGSLAAVREPGTQVRSRGPN